MKVLLDLRKGPRESGGGKCDGKSAQSHDDGDDLFHAFGHVHGVASIVGDPVYDARVCSSAAARVSVLDNMVGQEGLGEDETIVGDSLRGISSFICHSRGNLCGCGKKTFKRGG